MVDVEPKHEDVHASDDIHVTEWTPEIRISIEGFDQVFLAESRKAAGRAWEGLARGEGGTVAGATPAAVLLAAAACEARLSEYVTRYESAIGTPAVGEIRRPSRDHGDAAKQWRLLLASRAPTFKPDDSQLFVALRCLFELRDLVAHRNARFRPLGEWPKDLNECVRRKAIPVHEAEGIDWTSGVYVQQVAAWAAQTAGDWLATATRLGIA